MDLMARIFTLPLAWVLYAQISPSDPNSWSRVIETFGLPIALVVFFVWQWWCDKERTSKRMDDLEKWIQEEAVHRAEEIITSRNRFADSFERLAVAIEARPCFAGQKDILNATKENKEKDSI